MKAQLLQDYILHVNCKTLALGVSGRRPMKKDEYHGTTLIRLVDSAGLQACKDLENSIRRHCDGVGQIQIYPSVTQEVCEYCRALWLGATTFYNGGCCLRDEEHNPFPLLGPGRALTETA